MYWRIIINLILGLLLVALQLSFINLLPVFSYLNLILVILLFGLVVRDLSWASSTFLFIAFCLDALALSSFGVYLITYGLVLIVSYILLINFVTNRSLYSFLLLVGIATLLHDLILPLANYLIAPEAFLDFGTKFWLAEIWRLAANLLATGIIFYILNLFSKRFQPVFLRKRVFK
jgi:hypothetical protein